MTIYCKGPHYIVLFLYLELYAINLVRRNLEVELYEVAKLYICNPTRYTIFDD